MSYWLTTTVCVLTDAGALRDLRADRHVLVDRARRDDDTRRVHAGMARQTFERDRVVEQLLVALVVVVELPDFLDVLDRFGHGQREVRLIRDQLRERVGFRPA